MKSTQRLFVAQQKLAPFAYLEPAACVPPKVFSKMSISDAGLTFPGLSKWFVAIASALLLVGVPESRAQTQTTLRGGGATFPYPMYARWFAEYHKLHPDIEIEYEPIGSGAGIREITAGVFDFGASDGPMDNNQLKDYRAKRGMEVLHFPTVLGADVPTYNIPGVNAELKFTPETLAGIFLGKITKWNDPAIADRNKGVKLPAEDIVV